MKMFEKYDTIAYPVSMLLKIVKKAVRDQMKKIRRLTSLLLAVWLCTIQVMAGQADMDQGLLDGGKDAAVAAAAQAETGAEGTVPAETETGKESAALGVTARSALLMEASTGTVIYEKDADVRLRPASITKIMTLILIFDALAEGKIQLTDEVTTSAHAKSMGGSQVFLEEGEKQTVETLIKCIVVASGNDASVAMAEYI